MEDHWRRRAAAATGPTVVDTATTSAAIQAIDVAHGIFARAAHVCGRFRLGLQYQPGAGDGDALPHLPTAMGRVRHAIVSTWRVSASHAEAGRVFSLCAARLGLQGSAPSWWHLWESHHADAAARAAMALHWLYIALSRGASACGAVRYMLGTAPVQQVGGGHAASQLLGPAVQYNFGQRPQGFPLWDAWGQTAEKLLRRAADELAMARAALQRMRPAAVAELSAAFNLLSR